MKKTKTKPVSDLGAAAAALGRKGGQARKKALTPERRREIASLGGVAKRVLDAKHDNV